VAAEYDTGDNNEVFTLDGLGNTESVNVRDGNTITYDVNELTNRYASVGGSGLEYDAAGNLAKDRLGYEYEYDYENRIVKVTKDNNDIAEFAYDALGRRIRKSDCVADANTLYYYNDNWQVLCEYSGGIYFYVQDHLYSTAALVDASGAPQERYEYDAYGQVHILDANFADDADGVSDCGNPYMFTSRRVDFLDGGKLTLQINRHRYYDYYTGRWLTQDPLGMNPNASKHNLFYPRMQYFETLNLYQFVSGNPVGAMDPYGFGTTRMKECPTKCSLLNSCYTDILVWARRGPSDLRT